MKSPTKQTVINQTTTTQMIKFGINALKKLYFKLLCKIELIRRIDIDAGGTVHINANVIIHGNVTSYGIKNH